MNARIVFTDEDRARTKRLNFAFHGNVDAADDRRDQHHGDDADHDSEDGQERAQLVGAQRREGHLEVLVDVASNDFH